jgi:hypothetical protein
VLENADGVQLTIPAEASLTMPLYRSEYLHVKIRNLHVGAQSDLQVKLF